MTDSIDSSVARDREEDAQYKARLGSALGKIQTSNAKHWMKHPDVKISLTLTAGELKALRQFGMKFHDE